MIDHKVKSKEMIHESSEQAFMIKTMPDLKSIDLTESGVVCYTGYGTDKRNMTIIKQIKDRFGIVVHSVISYNKPWDQRKTM